MAELTDQDICQAKYHLCHVHFSFVVFCNVFRRHFSRQHPLYHVMKYHCEGTTPHIALVYPTLAAPEEAGHLLFTIGHVGFVKVSMEAFAKRRYGMLAYDNLLKVSNISIYSNTWSLYGSIRCRIQSVYNQYVRQSSRCGGEVIDV